MGFSHLTSQFLLVMLISQTMISKPTSAEENETSSMFSWMDAMRHMMSNMFQQMCKLI